MYQRWLRTQIEEACEDTPAVFVGGARQVGKSTLLRQLVEGDPGARYVTFDDFTALEAAQSDPTGFVRALPERVVLDEVQRVPDLFQALKLEIDRNREPGRFLMTGSADVMLLPAAAESLAGRMELLTLWSLSQGELRGHRETFIDALFSADPLPSTVEASEDDIVDLCARGGYPEVIARSSARRHAWYDSYVTAILQRDVRDLARIEGLADLPRLLSLVAARVAQLANYSEIGRAAGIPNTTLKRYMALLQATYLVRELPAWSPNLSKRVVKSPKLMLCDTGLAIHLLRTSAEQLRGDRTLLGHVAECFVYGEVCRQLGWSATRATPYHYRAGTEEVDIVLEAPDGRVVGIETKASATVRASDFRGMKTLRELPSFHRGVVLYSGDGIVPFGDDLFAVPFSALWQW